MEESESADCLECGKLVENEHQGIKCSDCSFWIHSDCIGKLDNQPGISPEIYARISDRKYEFHCPKCKSLKMKNLSFFQSLYDTGIILKSEAVLEKWHSYISFKEGIGKRGEQVDGQGDASSTSVQSPVKRQSVSHFGSQSPRTSEQESSGMLESELHREMKHKEKIEKEGFVSGGQGDASTYASTCIHSPVRTRTGEEFMKQFSESLVQGNSAGTENQMQTMMASMQMMIEKMETK